MNGTALLIAVALGVIALGYVFQPFFSKAPVTFRVAPRPLPLVQREDPVVAMEELDQDLASGKLSSEDYASLATRYTAGASAAVSPADAAEAAVAVLRGRTAVCVACGPRPEADPGYCSNCGRYLAQQCPACQRTVEERGARHCAGCGTDLAT